MDILVSNSFKISIRKMDTKVLVKTSPELGSYREGCREGREGGTWGGREVQGGRDIHYDNAVRI